MIELRSDLSRKEQERLKPKPEDLIPLCLEDDYMKNKALDFVTYLRTTNKTKLVWCTRNGWKISYKGEILCRMGVSPKGWAKPIDPPSWSVRFVLVHINEYEKIIMKERLQEFIWDNVAHCGFCRSECGGRRNVIILGKEIKDIGCGGNPWGIAIGAPDEAAISNIKKLLELEKQARDENSD